MQKSCSWLSSPYGGTAESQNATKKQNVSPEIVVFKIKNGAKWTLNPNCTLFSFRLLLVCTKCNRPKIYIFSWLERKSSSIYDAFVIPFSSRVL